MVGAALHTDGTAALSSAGAEALELFGGYLVARAYFFGPAALHTFLRVLRVFAFIAIVFAIADRASGTLIVHHTFASLLNVKSIDDQLRMGSLRPPRHLIMRYSSEHFARWSQPCCSIQKRMYGNATSTLASA